MTTTELPAGAGRRLPGVVDFAGPVVGSADLDVRDLPPASIVACLGTDEAMLDAVPALVAGGHEVRVFEDRPRLVLPDGPPTSCAGALAAAAEPAELLAGLAVHLPVPHELRSLLSDVPVHLRRQAGSRHRRRLVPDRWMRRQLTPAPHDHRPPLRSDAYYAALVGPGCRLVSWPVARITESGVRTCDGLEHRVDVLVVAR